MTHAKNINRKLDEQRRAAAKPDSSQNLKAIIRQMRDRDRLLTAQLAGVCNELADALGLKVDEIDPNRLSEYVNELAHRGESKRD